MPRRFKRWARVLAAFAVVSFGSVCLAGCSVLGGGDQGVISGVNLNDPTTVQAFYRIVGQPDAATAGQQLLARGASGTTRWAAIVAYDGDGADPGVLAPYIHDSDPSIRAAAAAGAVEVGDKDAFPVLISLLGQDGRAVGSDPPQQLWQIADQALVRATAMATFGPPLDGSIEEARAAQVRWQGWWKSNSSSLKFDSADALWETK